MSMAADLRPDRLEYVRLQYPSVAVSRDIGAVLNNPSIDGVIVATPVETHFELARAVLQAGKHALVEKPLAMTSAQCRELNAIAEERKRVLMVGHTFEYHPAVSFMRQMIQSGSLGELYEAVEPSSEDSVSAATRSAFSWFESYQAASASL
jgi:predicted dehydrogenase